MFTKAAGQGQQLPMHILRVICITPVTMGTTCRSEYQDWHAWKHRWAAKVMVVRGMSRSIRVEYGIGNCHCVLYHFKLCAPPCKLTLIRVFVCVEYVVCACGQHSLHTVLCSWHLPTLQLTEVFLNCFCWPCNNNWCCLHCMLSSLFMTSHLY